MKRQISQAMNFTSIHVFGIVGALYQGYVRAYLEEEDKRPSPKRLWNAQEVR
jgi:hypothetical protein